ncbi:MAG: Tad domain-containing protein [Anaerolineae bacterium]|nr:Tad domain-containing protein [Anaerolineae bacterium]
MKERNERNERGQTVVIVAFMVVVLLLMAGLAVDGGTAYLNRRRMQNAADAGSLAGAHALAETACADVPPNTADSVIHAAIVDYVQRNGVDDGWNDMQAEYVMFNDEHKVVSYAPKVFVGGGTVPNGATGVAVTTTITRPTYLLNLLGITTGGASAAATAVTGPPLLLGGLRPFGVPLEVMQQLNEGDCFTSSFKNCQPDAPPGDPNACYIYNDEGDSIGQHRNWLNLNHVWNEGEAPNFPRATGNPGSSAYLKLWMENGWQGTLYSDCFWSEGCHFGDYIHAKPGTNSAPIGHVPIDTVFFVPIFDIVPHYDEIPEPKADPHPQGGDFYYHVVGFVGVTVGPGDADQGGGTVRACITEMIIGEGYPSPNPGFGEDMCASHTMVVTLWR